jgi:hypothetical protein
MRSVRRNITAKVEGFYSTRAARRSNKASPIGAIYVDKGQRITGDRLEWLYPTNSSMVEVATRPLAVLCGWLPPQPRRWTQWALATTGRAEVPTAIILTSVAH